MLNRPWLLGGLALIWLSACGGGGSPSGPSNPTPPQPTPTPTPTPGHTVSARVFYDQNANGVLDDNEPVRIPSVSVSLGGRTGVSEHGGQVTVNDVPGGSHQAEIIEESLPPYFVSNDLPMVEVPQAAGAETVLPLTLPIGPNRANLYMAFGDSISSGLGSSSGEGYLPIMGTAITDHWGRAEISNQGVPGSRSNQGLDRIGQSLGRVRPAFTLILYGTNDWNRLECKDDRFPCYTIDALRGMIGAVRSEPCAMPKVRQSSAPFPRSTPPSWTAAPRSEMTGSSA
jgi:hypothetical protein